MTLGARLSRGRLGLLLALLLLAACRIAPPAVYPGAFSTARGEFVIYGDTRPWIFGEFWRAPAGDARRAVIARLAEEAPDFVLNTGDLVAFGSNAGAWAGFDEEMAPIREKGIAYFAALGNHDLWPDPAAALVQWNARFPHMGAQRWYALRHGAIDLVVLDTNFALLTPEQAAAQAAWYRDRLAADDADAEVRCVIVACHHTPRTNGIAHGSSDWVMTNVVEPGRTCSKFRAVFAGHVHSYERFLDRGVHIVVSGGGGAPLMDVAGPAGTNPDLYDGPRGHHFCRLIPRDDRIDVEVVMLGGDGAWFIADRFAIDLSQ